MSDNRKNAVDRRGFLYSAAAAGSSLGLAPAVLGSVASDATDALHVALIGGGEQGEVLLKSCLKIAGIHYRAICDIWEERALARAARLVTRYGHQPALYTDYRQMLDKEKGLDAVLIATPDFCHAEQTAACLKAGAHVYCEAPMSNTLDGARTMTKTAQETGRLLQIGYQRRSNPRYQHVHNHLLGELKLLGRIGTMNAQWNRPVQPDRGWPRRSPLAADVLRAHGYASMQQLRNWRWYRELGSGPLGEVGAHQIDVLNWFIGARPQAVLASGGTDYYESKSHEWADTVLAIYEYETKTGPARATYQLVNTNGNLADYERLLGDEGTLVISESAGGASLYREEGALEWDKWVDLDLLVRPGTEEGSEHGGTGQSVVRVTETVKPTLYHLPVTLEDPVHKPHLENFFNATRGTGALNCPAEVAYATTVSAFKVAEAMRSGRKIEFQPEEFVVR